MRSLPRPAAHAQTPLNLVAVTKKQPAELVQEYLDLAKRLGFSPILGENYVQEFKKKKLKLTGDFRAHLIGPLQSGNVREAVRIFDMIESVHTEEIAAQLNKEAEKCGKVLEILLQVNISSDDAKSGFSPERAKAMLADGFTRYPSLKFCGFMSIPRYYEIASDVKVDFAALANLKAEVQDSWTSTKAKPEIFHLSMGMSRDYEIAISEGASLVRIGTALFGERS